MGAGTEQQVREQMTIEDAAPWFAFSAYEDFVHDEYVKKLARDNA